MDRENQLHPHPEAVFALIAQLPGSVWLDGGRAGTTSLIAWNPVEVITDGDEWDKRGRELSANGWVLGYLGYGAGHQVEQIPPEAPTPEPEIWLGQFDGVLRFDHSCSTWQLEGSAAFQARAQDLLDRAQPLAAPPAATPPTSVHTTHRERHEAAVECVLDWIAQGDCYQISLTRPVYVRGAGDPWQTYRRLRRVSAPAYGAFIRLAPDLAVLSNSPELFIEVRDRHVRSVPIKGTRPRHADPRMDHALSEALRHSPKELAELTMIVDLVRNDLGRVATPGSVVAAEREIVAHSTVHHAHRSVSAQLSDGLDCWSALAATFPPGSVTGAPKVRAARRISELEDGPRGIYCGAIGYVAPNGDSTWSVAIRTGVWNADVARFHVGGGIVWDSIPTDEWHETVHKAAAFRRAIGIEDASEVSAPERGPARPSLLN